MSKEIEYSTGRNESGLSDSENGSLPDGRCRIRRC